MNYVPTASTLFKRAVEEGNKNIISQLPSWAWVVLVADALIFIPIFVPLVYTLGSLYPVLAIVEDPNPPAYESVPPNEDAESVAEDNTPPSAAVGLAPKPITSSLRSINRLLYSIAGWRSNFRGIICALALGLATSFVNGIFSQIPFVPSFVGSLLASLALVQLSTAWVHIVISPPNKAPFYRRLLPFRKVLKATWLPVLISWAATIPPQMIMLLQGQQLHAIISRFSLGDPKKPTEVLEHIAWKSVLIMLVSLAWTIFILIPTTVLLVRVQASLLAEEEDTIIPFDRSFGGKVEPAIVSGKGYVTAKDALQTVSRASWVRIYGLFFKIVLINVLAELVMMVIIFSQAILMSKKST